MSEADATVFEGDVWGVSVRRGDDCPTLVSGRDR